MAISDINDPLELLSGTDNSPAWRNYKPSDIKKAVEKSTEKIISLDSKARWPFIVLWNYTFRQGLLPYFFSGRRGFDQQADLYDDYKEGRGGKAAPPGFSYHNYGRAIDGMVWDYRGRGNMPGGLKKMQQVNVDKKIGLRWGRTFDDPNHWAYTKDSIQKLQQSDPEFLEWRRKHPEYFTEAIVAEGIQNELAPTWWQRNKPWLLPVVVASVATLFIYLLYKLSDNE